MTGDIVIDLMIYIAVAIPVTIFSFYFIRWMFGIDVRERQNNEIIKLLKEKNEHQSKNRV